MSIDQRIDTYDGVVPDKDTQTPSEFNSAADTFVDYFEKVPSQYNTFADEANTTADTINSQHSDIDIWHTETQAYKDDSYEWATRSEDSEYTDSDGNTGYSAYHWAQKSAKGERLTASSTSSVTVGTGSKTFTLAESYRAFTAGSKVRIVDGSNPSTNYMEGVVTAYDDGTDELTVDVATTGGSGTISDWAISLTHGGDATSVDGSTLADIKTYAFTQAIIFG